MHKIQNMGKRMPCIFQYTYNFFSRDTWWYSLFSSMTFSSMKVEEEEDVWSHDECHAHWTTHTCTQIICICVLNTQFNQMQKFSIHFRFVWVWGENERIIIWTVSTLSLSLSRFSTKEKQTNCKQIHRQRKRQQQKNDYTHTDSFVRPVWSTNLHLFVLVF